MKGMYVGQGTACGCDTAGNAVGGTTRKTGDGGLSGDESSEERDCKEDEGFHGWG